MFFPVLQHHLHLQSLLLEVALLLCHGDDNIILVEYCSLLADCLQVQLVEHLLFLLVSVQNRLVQNRPFITDHSKQTTFITDPFITDPFITDHVHNRPRS